MATVDPNNYDKMIGYKILKLDFQEMMSAVKGFKGSPPGTPPTIVYIRKGLIKQPYYITYAKYLKMVDVWNAFVKLNRYIPNWIYINPYVLTHDTVVGGRSAKLICGEDDTKYAWGDFYQVTYVNKCPNCGRLGTLTSPTVANKPLTQEGEITCDPAKDGCDSDFDILYGQDKAPACHFIEFVGTPVLVEAEAAQKGKKPYFVKSEQVG